MALVTHAQQASRQTGHPERVRSRQALAFSRFPHTRIEHQVRDRFRLRSKNAHRHSSAGQIFTRSHSPSTANRTAAASTALITSTPANRGTPPTTSTGTAKPSREAGSPAAAARSPSRTARTRAASASDRPREASHDCHPWASSSRSVCFSRSMVFRKSRSRSTSCPVVASPVRTTPL